MNEGVKILVTLKSYKIIKIIIGNDINWENSDKRWNLKEKRERKGIKLIGRNRDFRLFERRHTYLWAEFIYTRASGIHRVSLFLSVITSLEKRHFAFQHSISSGAHTASASSPITMNFTIQSFISSFLPPISPFYNDTFALTFFSQREIIFS